MIAEILITAWNLAALVALFGPLGWVITRWEREDRLNSYEMERLGQPLGRRPRLRARRWAIGIAVFLASTPIAGTMFNASDAIAAVLRRAAPF